MDIHELFEAAGNLHGHLCPGLAIGVRAAAEAGGLLHGELRCETGKPVFNFYGAGGELRLYLRPLPKLADKSALIEYILTAPAAEIFCSGIPHMPFPAAPQRRDELPCAVCGELTREDFLQIRCGVPVCADCAEKQSPDR